MGTSKAWLQFDGEYLLQRIGGVLAQAARPVVLATRHELELPPMSPEFRIVFDEHEHRGPLAGIAAGMTALQHECDAVLVTACDHPFISSGVCHRMIELLGDHLAVVPDLEGRLLPTLAAYRLSTLPMLEDNLSKRQYRAQDFALQCNPRRISRGDLADVDPDLRSLWNINNPAEFDAALRSDAPSNHNGTTCEP